MEDYLVFRKPWSELNRQGAQVLHRPASLLDFSERIHFSHGGKAEDIEHGKRYVADIGAAALANYCAKRGVLALEQVNELMEFCRDIMVHRGYEEDYAYTLKDRVRKAMTAENSESLIVVFGCQTDSILQARAFAAADIYQALYPLAPQRFSLVISGLGPSNTVNRQLQKEYVRLERHVRSRLSGKIENLELVPLVNESASTSSIENIKGVFDQVIFKKHRRKTLNLLFVSTNWHLIRLSQVLERHLNDVAVQAEMEASEVRLDRLIFIGSEVPGRDSEMLFHRAYLKGLFYEPSIYLIEQGIMPTPG